MIPLLKPTFQSRRAEGDSDSDDGVIDITDIPVFSFGKYQHIDYKTITEEETHYYFWAKKEKRPSKYLMHYLEWVESHYVADDAAQTVQRTKDLQEARNSAALLAVTKFGPKKSAGPKAKAPPAGANELLKNKLTRQQAYQKGQPQCIQCTRFDKGGSNIFQDTLTCMDCGRQVKTPKETADPTTCSHANLCNARSSKTTHRVTCADCGEIIYEEPQSVYRERGCEAPGFEHASSSSSKGGPSVRPQAPSRDSRCLKKMPSQQRRFWEY